MNVGLNSPVYGIDRTRLGAALVGPAGRPVEASCPSKTAQQLLLLFHSSLLRLRLHPPELSSSPTAWRIPRSFHPTRFIVLLPCIRRQPQLTHPLPTPTPPPSGPHGTQTASSPHNLVVPPLLCSRPVVPHRIALSCGSRYHRLRTHLLDSPPSPSSAHQAPASIRIVIAVITVDLIARVSRSATAS